MLLWTSDPFQIKDGITENKINLVQSPGETSAVALYGCVAFSATKTDENRQKLP